MPNYPILIWLDKFYVFLTGYNKIRRKRPGSKFKWRPHVASQPLAEVSTGGTLDRGGRPAMASNFHRLSLILRKSSRVRWGNSKIFETCLSIVINLETSVGLRIGIVVDILSKPKHKFFKRNLETYLMTKSGDKRGKKHIVIKEGLCRPCHETQLAGSSDICLMVAACCCGQAWVWTPQYISPHSTVYRHQPLPDTISQPLSWK